MSSLMDEFLGDIGLDHIADINKDETPEQKMYREQTEGKYPKIANCVYWLKHELHVYMSLKEIGWHVSKPNGATRLQVSLKELARGLLAYYWRMIALPRFEGEDAIRRGTAVDMEKWLDLVIEYPTIKNLIDNPTLLV